MGNSWSNFWGLDTAPDTTPAVPANNNNGNNSSNGTNGNNGGTTGSSSGTTGSSSGTTGSSSGTIAPVVWTDKMVCEGGTLSLECPTGTRIALKDAMYGRVDGTSCGSSTTRNCKLAPEKMKNLFDLVRDKQQVTIQGLDGTFYGHDPCVGTPKYTHFEYACVTDAQLQVPCNEGAGCDSSKYQFCIGGQCYSALNLRPPNAPPLAKFVKIEKVEAGSFQVAEIVIETVDGVVLTKSDLTGTAAGASHGKTADVVFDGSTGYDWGSGSVFHTGNSGARWVQLSLNVPAVIKMITVYNRTDTCCSGRLAGCVLSVLGENGEPVMPNITLTAELVQKYQKQNDTWVVMRN